jgi:hypothetical protein
MGSGDLRRDSCLDEAAAIDTVVDDADEVDPSLIVYAGRHVREKRLDVEECTLLRGQRSEREIADAGAGATASDREGYGLVVVEAAARGMPSVVGAGKAAT